jgi:hypothetical protein
VLGARPPGAAADGQRAPVRVDGVEFLAQGAALTTAGGETVGGFAVLRPLDAERAELTGVQRSLAAAGLVGLVLALAAAWGDRAPGDAPRTRARRRGARAPPRATSGPTRGSARVGARRGAGCCARRARRRRRDRRARDAFGACSPTCATSAPSAPPSTPLGPRRRP